jgi:hypothetical protein
MVDFREARVEALGRVQGETTSPGHKSQRLSAPHELHNYSFKRKWNSKSCHDKIWLISLCVSCTRVLLLSTQQTKKIKHPNAAL